MRKKQQIEHTPLLVLSLLAGEDMYGYQMIIELARRSNHTFEMKEGTLYPVLHGLEQQGYVEAYQQEAPTGRMRKYYHLTRKGGEALRTEAESWKRYSGAVDAVLQSSALGAGVMDRAEYCAQVLSCLHRLSAAEREAVRAELEAHMEDHVCALLELGYDEQMAEERTMAAMGDPAEVGREMEKQYPRGWRILGRAAMVLTLLLALFLAQPLLERVPAAWDSLRVRCAPRAVLDISERQEGFEPLGLDAWDMDEEVVIQDVHFRVYQAGYDPERAEGDVRLAVACWRTNPFQEELDWMDGFSVRILVDGEENGCGRQPWRRGIDLYGVWADPGQMLTVIWEVYGETDTVSFTLPEVGS